MSIFQQSAARHSSGQPFTTLRSMKKKKYSDRHRRPRWLNWDGFYRTTNCITSYIVCIWYWYKCSIICILLDAWTGCWHDFWVTVVWCEASNLDLICLKCSSLRCLNVWSVEMLKCFSERSKEVEETPDPKPAAKETPREALGRIIC